MESFRRGARAAGALLFSLLAPASAGAVSQSDIATLVRHSGLAASTSIVIGDAGGGTLYRRRSTVALTPASNEKLVTAVTALDLLG